jgi:putative peptide zinc metalloprotease protein
MTECQKYRFNPEAEILRLDTSLKDRMYQLRLGDSRYRINETTLGFLRQFEEAQEEQALDSALQGSPAELKDFLIQKNILIKDAASPPPAISKRNHPFAVHLSLFSQRRLQPLTAPLAFFFSPVIALFAVVFIVCGHALFLYYAHPALHFLKLGQQQWIVAVIASYFLTFIHELGHSSACTHYGAQHGDIGIGIYFIYPVFYANVTDCWRLPRYQRAVVDMAGIYFQLLAASACGMFWLYTRQPVLLVLVYGSLATILINLNPFLRFDGYWLLTDVTGLPSLQRSNQELWRYWWRKLRRKDQDIQVPEFFSASAKIKVIFVLYSVCSLSFFTLFFGRLAILLFPYLLHEYPRALGLVSHLLISGQFNSALLKAVFRLLGLSATSFGFLMMTRGLVIRMFRLLQKVYAHLRKAWGHKTATENRRESPAGPIPVSTPE